MLGKRSEQKATFLKRTGCIWTTWARIPSTACWQKFTAALTSCSAMTISPRIYCPDNGSGQRAAQPAGHGAAVAELTTRSATP